MNAGLERMLDGPRRIGIVMLTAVGDAVHVLPVINALKRHNPSHHLTWVLQPGPARLVRGHPAIDEIIVFERSRGWRAWLETRAAMRAHRFDLVLGLQSYLKAGILTALAPTSIRLGYDRPRARDANWLFTNRRIPAHAPQHLQDEYFEFLAALDVNPEPVEWNLGPWPEERAAQAVLLAPFERPIVPLVIATSKAEKNWVPRRWAELADALRGDFGLFPVLAGGRSTLELSIEREVNAHARFTHPTTLGIPLRDLVGLIDGSSLVVSPDTGPLHMSIALGRPAIALMGYYNPLRTGPYRQFQDLLVNGYGETHRNGELCTDSRPGRMATISVRDVLEKVDVWRTNYRGGGVSARPA